MPVVVTWYSNFWPKATFVLLEEEPEVELEMEMSSDDDEDELSVLSLVLSSPLGLQDENNTAMLNSRTNQVNKILKLFLKKKGCRLLVGTFNNC